MLIGYCWFHLHGRLLKHAISEVLESILLVCLNFCVVVQNCWIRKLMFCVLCVVEPGEELSELFS
jgi:hypothetical protein